MADMNFLGLRRPRPEVEADRVEHIIVQRPLHRVLAFTRRSIDDVVNCPVAKSEVLGYFKLHRWVQRQSEVSELEKQWNGHPL